MQDYLYRSVDALVPLLLLAALIGLIGLQLHVLVIRQLDRCQGRKILALVAQLMAVVGTGGVALGAMALFRSLPFVPDFLFPPLSLALGASLLAYGVYLNRRIGSIEGRAASKTREECWLATGTTTLLGLLVAVGLFWAAKDFADALGRGRAQQLVGRLHPLPSVIVYSDKQLHFSDAHGVQEKALERVNDNVRFRYSNLRLFLRSGDNYFLIPDGWTQKDGGITILPDDSTIQILLAQRTREASAPTRPAGNPDSLTPTKQVGDGGHSGARDNAGETVEHAGTTGNNSVQANRTTQQEPNTPTATPQQNVSPPTGNTALTRHNNAGTGGNSSVQGDETTQQEPNTPTATPQENFGPMGPNAGTAENNALQGDETTQQEPNEPTFTPKEDFGPPTLYEGR
jgi:hypothetical protein